MKNSKVFSVEMGEFKNAQVKLSIDNRRQAIFSGQAVVPKLEGDDETGLRIVAPGAEIACQVSKTEVSQYKLAE
jgi:hypothetical protein